MATAAAVGVGGAMAGGRGEAEGGPSGKSRSKADRPAAADPSLKRKRGVFGKELRLMMYGFGDDPDPLPETVELVEDIVIDYITDMIHRAQDLGSRQQKLAVEDIMFLIRKDPRKFARVKELLAMNEELKRARKAFEMDEEKMPEGE